jgi:F-type H+-transporting ATPase subunit gamma
VAAASTELEHGLLESREPRTIGVVVVGSDRGLAGSHNSSVVRSAENRLNELRANGTGFRIYCIGRKPQTYLRYRGYQVERTFLGVTDTPGYGDARAVANVLMNDFAEAIIDSVEVHSTRYRSALVQHVTRLGLLPAEPPTDGAQEDAGGYSFEPSAEVILSRLLPRYVEAMVFGVLLDASASEHAARRQAMKAATENAEELIHVLTRQANRARQSEITTEITEIVGGAEALARG